MKGVLLKWSNILQRKIEYKKYYILQHKKQKEDR